MTDDDKRDDRQGTGKGVGMQVGWKNLRPIHTTEKARELGRKGGYSKARKLHERRTMLDDARALLDLPVKSRKTRVRIDKAKGIDEVIKCDKDHTLTVQQLLVLRMIKLAMATDDLHRLAKALETLRDTSGQKPADKQELTATVPVDLDVVQSLVEQQVKQGTVDEDISRPPEGLDDGVTGGDDGGAGDGDDDDSQPL
ncbi:MAG: hypothetical protein WCS71_03730 [Sphaerochaetaceae bacterium]